MTVISGNGHHKHHDLPEPEPGLAPDEVVRIIMTALQHNNDPCMDCGIETAFNFASPSNRAVTGPLPRFVEMVRNPIYDPLIHAVRFEQDTIQIDGDEARQDVRVYDADGNRAVYVFILSKQPGPAWEGCWMTDSVIRTE